MKLFDLKEFVMQGLRRFSYRYPVRKQVLKDARIARGKYKCANCQNIFGPREIHVDHIDPVINPATGFIDWNTYIERLFPPYNGMQVLCAKTCHKIKTAKENARRRGQKWREWND